MATHFAPAWRVTCSVCDLHRFYPVTLRPTLRPAGAVLERNKVLMASLSATICSLDGVGKLARLLTLLTTNRDSHCEPGSEHEACALRAHGCFLFATPRSLEVRCPRCAAPCDFNTRAPLVDLVPFAPGAGLRVTFIADDLIHIYASCKRVLTPIMGSAHAPAAFPDVVASRYDGSPPVVVAFQWEL